MKKAVIFDMYGVLIRRNFFINEQENTQMTQVLRDLKARGVRLYLLSNIFIWPAERFEQKFAFLQLFDKLYFSSETGLSKPDPAAFRRVLEENNLAPEDCVFFDDTPRHVAAAKALGIEAHVFAGVADVRAKLGL